MTSALLALVWMNAACMTRLAQAPGSTYVVTAPKAAFYKYGPAQSFGPDFQLSKGQKVTMIERTYGFSRVKTQDGTVGYIAGDDIKFEPPAPVPGGTGGPGGAAGAVVAGVSPPMPKRGGGVWVEKHSNVAPTPESPLFDVSDLPTPPLPEKAEKTETPPPPATPESSELKPPAFHY
ncbi:MAG: SH3 domain-containing protein [Verrucomicrobiota bacterium]